MESFRFKYSPLFTIIVPCTLLLLFVLFHSEPWIIFAVIFVVVVNFFAQKVLGRSKSSKYIKLIEEKSSLSGTLISFLVTILFIGLFLVLYSGKAFKSDFSDIILASISISTIISAVSLFSYKGIEFFTASVFTAFLLYAFLYHNSQHFSINLFTGILFGLLIALISFKLKILTLNGVFIAFILGSLIYGFGGWQWTLPIIAFFLLSSILTKYRVKKNPDVEFYFEKSGQRDYLQVLANGGAAGLLVIFTVLKTSEPFYIFYVSCLAAVCADTWGTEIGTLFKGKVISILTFERVEQGTSGGISIIGTFGCFLGAFIIALSSLIWVNKSFSFAAVVISSGFLASLIDSILGAFIQAKYECAVCGKITERREHCGEVTGFKKGVSWINNDFVNFLTGISGGIFALLLLDLF
jgi:uncharacterized protein (TIGR00297 family)